MDLGLAAGAGEGRRDRGHREEINHKNSDQINIKEAMMAEKLAIKA